MAAIWIINSQELLENSIVEVQSNTQYTFDLFLIIKKQVRILDYSRIFILINYGYYFTETLQLISRCLGKLLTCRSCLLTYKT